MKILSIRKNRQNFIFKNSIISRKNSIIFPIFGK